MQYAKRPSKSARYTAIQTLCRLGQSRKPVKLILDSLAEDGRLSGEDRALAMHLTYGVLRQRDCLAWLIGHLSRHPVGRLDPFIFHALEVGLFQLFFLHRIPESAAVNETVKAVKAAGLPQRLQGFVNGILRESIRRRSTLSGIETDPRSGHPWLNHPQWLTDRWLKRFGEDEMRRICAVNNCEPMLMLKINTRKITRDIYFARLVQAGIICRRGLFAPDAIALPAYKGPISQLPGYADGHFLIQDEAAQLTPLLLGPFHRQGRYLDACAGLGGKTATLVELAHEYNLQITAVEPDPYRYKKMEENLRRLHPDNLCTTWQCSLQQFAENDGGSFHGVLVDAPCSGTGVTGRHPDIRWNRRADDFNHYRDNQIGLLEQAAVLVGKGGVLVYATCSLEVEENEEVIAHFLNRHSEFFVDDPGRLLPPASRRFVNDTFFSPRPEETIDGFFAARLVRR